MVQRRTDREIAEQMLNYLKQVKSVATEGELASSLKINSKTASKWLELFLLIKENCPDFEYKKLGRYRLIDKIGLGNLAHELSEVELKEISGPVIRATRYEALNTIHYDIRRIAGMLVYRLKHSELKEWTPIIKDSYDVLTEIINVNLNTLAPSKKKAKDFQIFKSSLKQTIDNFIKSIIDCQNDETAKPILELITLERDFSQKILFITKEFEESELKAGKKPDFNPKKDPFISPISSLVAELKVKLDNLPNTLQEINKTELNKEAQKPKVSPILKCFSCKSEQKFPEHCTQHMNYEDGLLVCEICKEQKPIPTCTNCNQQYGLGVKKEA